MTAIRRHKLLNEMISYIAEVIDQDEELYNILHGTFGMTNAEIRECGINFLDDYFQADSDKDRLMQKIEHCYQRCRRKWSQMTPEQILDEIDEIHAVSVVYRVITERRFRRRHTLAGTLPQSAGSRQRRVAVRKRYGQHYLRGTSGLSDYGTA